MNSDPQWLILKQLHHRPCGVGGTSLVVQTKKITTRDPGCVNFSCAMVGLASLAAEHELIAVGVDAHGEVGRFSVLGLWFLWALSSVLANLAGPCDDIGNLEGQSGPCAFAFASAMDGDTPATDFEFSDVGIGFYHGGSEDLLVEASGTRRVGGPDGVFQLLDLHRVRVCHLEGGCNLRDGSSG